MPLLLPAISQQARLSYLALSSIQRASLSTSAKTSAPSSFSRSDFQGQPFTGIYEAGHPPRGPLGETSVHGVNRITPRRLKEYVDQYVVGQDKPKKVLCTAVYNHYQRVQELKRQDDEEQERLAQDYRKYEAERVRGERGLGDKVQSEFPSDSEADQRDEQQRSFARHQEEQQNQLPFEQPQPIGIEKSNILVLGPTGVGKTLIVKTLARALEVPFSMSDCTPLTQAGYIGEDAEVCVHRLLAQADWDVARAEHGIICLDEVDKLAAMRTASGRDVGGEGVQQALLKIIEGTTITITAKSDQRSSQRPSSPNFGSNFGASSTSSQSTSSPKPETYTIRTDNILFICTGAFTNLHKIVLDRISKGSMGFGAPVRNSSSTSSPTLTGEDAALYFKNLPFYSDQASTQKAEYNPLDLVQPTDLQKFGLIPEFLGRIPVTVSLSALSVADLQRVLTEPRNSLTAQYVALFNTYGVDLRFTTPAVYEIAKTAFDMGTGARGVRTAVEALLAEAMYEVPGSSVRYVLVTAKAARREEKPIYWGRGHGSRFLKRAEEDDAEWESKNKKPNEGETDRNGSSSFEEFRVKAVSGM